MRWTGTSQENSRPENGGAASSDQIAPYIPSLRAYACNLTRNPSDADDLVQETLLRALICEDQFTPGTNLRGWLCMILKNVFRTNYRKARREKAVLGQLPRSICVEPTQEWSIQVNEMRRALGQLPETQRRVLGLIVAEGSSYREAAAACDCAVGTIRSRVNRGRCRLLELLGRTERPDRPSERIRLRRSCKSN